MRFFFGGGQVFGAHTYKGGLRQISLRNLLYSRRVAIQSLYSNLFSSNRLVQVERKGPVEMTDTMTENDLVLRQVNRLWITNVFLTEGVVVSLDVYM